MITKEELVEMASPTFKKRINDEYIAAINSALGQTDELEVEKFKENIITYQKVMSEGKYKLNDYIYAVKYVGFKIMGMSNRESYKKTFPEKWERMLEKLRENGMLEDEILRSGISPYVHSYNNGKLVNEIYRQTMVPIYILNQNMIQQALNVQGELMLHAKSETVRQSAADSVMTHLKMPETIKMEVDIGVKEPDFIAELRKATIEHSRMQQDAIRGGLITSLDAAESKLMSEVIEVEDE